MNINKINNESLTSTSSNFEFKDDFIKPMPLDIVRNIFAWAKEELPIIALVSSTWKTIVYDKNFHNLIGLPTEHFVNNEVWKRLPCVEVEEEPYLPLCIYRDIKPNDFLALVHKTVKIEGKEIKIGPKLLGELAAKQLKNLNQSGFAENSASEGIDKHSGSKTLHWVWIQGNPIGQEENFLQQVKSADLFGGQISEFLDTLVCLFLDRVKSGSSEFHWNKNFLIRVADEINNQRITIDFSSNDLQVLFTKPTTATPLIGIAVARKSIGI